MGWSGAGCALGLAAQEVAQRAGQTLGSSSLQGHRPALGHAMPEAGEARVQTLKLEGPLGIPVVTASPWHAG